MKYDYDMYYRFLVSHWGSDSWIQCHFNRLNWPIDTDLKFPLNEVVFGKLILDLCLWARLTQIWVLSLGQLMLIVRDVGLASFHILYWFIFYVSANQIARFQTATLLLSLGACWLPFVDLKGQLQVEGKGCVRPAGEVQMGLENHNCCCRNTDRIYNTLLGFWHDKKITYFC
jgi:hypothetical protein